MVAYLTAHHTMNLHATCQELHSFYSLNTLKELLRVANGPVVVLGSGSNVILAHHFAGTVLVNKMQGIYLLHSCKDFVDIEVAAGENWHDFVVWSVGQGFYGLENLALIPGTVGAAPVQNIGAYGVDISHFFVSCRVWDLQQKRIVVLSNKACKFSYRASIFKSLAKGRYIILSVCLRLYQQARCCLTYPRLRQFFDDTAAATPQAVLAAVMSIRQQRLPDWEKIGTVGSFFVNPIVSKAQADNLRSKYKDMITIALPHGKVKLFAGDLLRLAGWRAYADNALMTSAINPIVLMHKGGACRADLKAFVEKLILSVDRQFQVRLQVEPEIFPDKDGWCN